jgi:branched-chain amino acid transport system substrate-binding protein
MDMKSKVSSENSSLPVRRLVYICVFGLMALASPAAALDETRPFRIGAVIEKTGVFAPFGKFMEPGLIVAVNEINAMGGILNRKVELVIRDDASNPGRGLLAIKELVGDQHVDFLYAGVISGIVLASLPYATEQKMFSIANGSSPLIGDSAKFPYSFQLSDISSKRVAPVAEALRKLGGHKVGIITTTNPPNYALGEGLIVDLPKKYGMEVAGREVVTEGVKDLTPMLQKLRDAGADIIAFDGIGREGIRMMMSGLQTLSWNAKMVTEPAVLSGDIVGLMAPSLAGQFYSVNSLAGTRVGSQSNPRMDDFVAKLKALGPVENVAWSALARDAVYLAKWTFETAQKQHGNTDPDTLRATLEQIGTAAYPLNYALVFGNPGYTPADHTTANADYSSFWALIHTSPLVDGTYEGEPLVLK